MDHCVVTVLNVKCIFLLVEQPSDALILGKIKNVDCVLLARSETFLRFENGGQPRHLVANNRNC